MQVYEVSPDSQSLIPRDRTRDAPRPAYLFHVDAFGPLRVRTRGGSRYFFLYLDNFSKWLRLTMTRTLATFADEFLSFSRQLEAQFGRERVISQLHADSAPYFVSGALQSMCRRLGILQIYSPYYTQAMNPAERAMRSVVEMARCLLRHAGAPLSLAGEALQYAVNILNCVPRYFPDGTYGSPIERWLGRPMPRAYCPLRVWGCAAWPKILRPGNNKLRPTAHKHVLLGLDTHGRGYRLGLLPHYKLVFSAHVTFNEAEMPMHGSVDIGHNYVLWEVERPLASANADLPASAVQAEPPSHAANEAADKTHSDLPADAADLPDDFADSLDEAAGIAPEVDSVAQHHRRPQRRWTPSVRTLEALADTGSDAANSACDFGFAFYAASQLEAPSDHGNAMRGPQAAEWRKAEIEEYLAHVRNETFGPPVPLPSSFKAPCGARVQAEALWALQGQSCHSRLPHEIWSRLQRDLCSCRTDHVR